MFRTLIVLAALAMSGCASYGTTHHHHDDRAPVYADGSYYSPSTSGYGDYYYAPEYRYDPYYDDFGYGFGYPYGYGYGAHRFCSFRYRPCSYGSYWGSGFGLSLFFGRGWNHWDPWYPWPYYGWHHDWDRDRDWNRDRDDRPREPSPPYTGGDRNRARPPSAGSTPWPMPRHRVTPPRTDTPYPIRDRNRDPRYRDDSGALPQPMPRDRDAMPVPRDRNFVVVPRDPSGEPRPVYGVRPAPQPRDRNGGGGNEQPPPRAPEPRDRNDDDRPSPPPTRGERSDERRDDRNTRRGGERRPALQ